MELDDPERFGVQNEINQTEQWMISKGYKTTGITKWNVTSDSKNYPDGTGYIFFEDIKS